MKVTILRNYAILGALALFVGYFGVWELYRISVSPLGQIWAMVLAFVSAIGLLVIIRVGVIMVKTNSIMSAGENK